ncbi:MAG TPA: glycoside hydrolase family 127 protein, partial [Chitinophagaceae bacterium]|nr:glycoside hydrolase family 127 protein [Chitinophagaceae bacterium]
FGYTQFVALPKEAKFSFGDNPAWSASGFDDSGWIQQQLAKSYTKDSSYAWYRIRVIIPSSLKTKDGRGLKLMLGKIDDADQTWFNGRLIGTTGSFPPAYETQWEKQRLYIIPENEVQWDKENIIAVRIYNLIGGMGMWEGPYRIEPLGWTDEVSVSRTFTEAPENGVQLKLVFSNKVNKAFTGSVYYWVADKDEKKILFSEVNKVNLPADKEVVTIVDFSTFRKTGTDVFKVGYRINDDSSTLFTTYDQLFIASSALSIPVRGEVRPVVTDIIKEKFTALPFNQQQLKGYLNTRLLQNLEQRLLNVDEEGLMGSYFRRPGIHPWAGEHVGKYLETACNTWKLTRDPRLKKQMDRIMYGLINTQLADGYLGTYTPDQYWTSWDVWSHKYNLYGLLAYYTMTGYKPALEACIKMGDLLCKTFGDQPGKLDIISAGTHMGMAATSVLDPMVELYKYTGDKKYLDFCYYILRAWEQDNGPKLFSTLLTTGNVAKVGNGKTYEMISNFVGLANLYRLTGDAKLLEPLLIAWKDIVKNRLYITGTASAHEYFQEPGHLPAGLDASMGEGCVTTTWMQFNHQLYLITGENKYLEQIEKTVYNHLIGAENPQTGCVSYYTPLMGKKPYTCYITCCMSSIPRGIAMIPYFTYGRMGNSPSLQLYEPGTYTDTLLTAGNKRIGLKMELKNQFPETAASLLTLQLMERARFPLVLRVPEWCQSFTATIGPVVYKGMAGKNLVIERNWNVNEQVKINFNMPVFEWTGGKSYPGQVAFQRGPQVLAIDSAVKTSSDVTIDQIKLTALKAGGYLNMTQSSLLPEKWIGKQLFPVYYSDGSKLILIPFADAGQTGGSIRVWLPLAKKP